MLFVEGRFSSGAGKFVSVRKFVHCNACGFLLTLRIETLRFELTSFAATPGAHKGEGVRCCMNLTFLKALVALVPACMLFSGSVVLFLGGKTVSSFLQLLGAGCLVVVVLTHVSEALHLFPWMHFGLEHSLGHYLDFASAVLGLTLFPLGYLVHALTNR